jgi:xanthine dehydrogenase small subunit
MITFIINNELVSTIKPSGTSLLDYLRYEMDLPGTKSGCREGDCGACTVLEGTLINNKVSYKSIVSCLTPLVNVQGRHIVTIEGINMQNLSPVQNAIVRNNGTQCGFCTPGLVMSLSAHGLSMEKTSHEKALAAISGNICRCTGYKSIEKAAFEISRLLKDKDIKDPAKWLVGKGFLPEYFLKIPERLIEIKAENADNLENGITIAGGTDLMVQRADELNEMNITSLKDSHVLKGITVEKGKYIIGAASNASEIEQSTILKDILPDISSWFKLISSESIRNMGTIAGNIVNASPIGDLTIFFLALNAELKVAGSGTRTIPLKDFFTGYKKIGLDTGEYIMDISFIPLSRPILFNFEKVSKRTHLDIASVNSAIQIVMKGEKIKECYLSAGGVSPIPLFMTKTVHFLEGKTVSPDVILKASTILQEEISPISDVRGSSEYKRLLLRQLFFCHFLKLFPDRIPAIDLLQKI